MNEPEPRYSVLFDNELIAAQMEISNATILIKALVEKYYESMKLGAVISICRMEEEEVVCKISVAKFDSLVDLKGELE